MIQISSAAKRFGAKTLFEGLDWLIHPQERVAVVGGNGSGKSTLLKVLAGLEHLDGGIIAAAKGITIGYLPQDGLALSGRTVLDECLSVFGDLLSMEKELEALTHQMSELDPESEAYQRVADRYHRLETEFQGRHGYSLEAQAGAVLNGLGFTSSDWSRPTQDFSGGWQMRLALAKLLLVRPDLLLLDEPTNHLDLEARNWLEQYLKNYPGAYVLVSHDRYFLDVTVDRILELWNRRAYFYTGNYDRYLTQKAERQEQLRASFRNQQERIQQLEVFINRFRYQATKAKQVQSRIKELERIERIELPPDEKTIHFKFPQPPASGRMVAECRSVAKRYGEKLVFAGVNFVINRGDRVALVGVNGAGKSTLIKLLAGAEPVTSGELRLGHKVEVDYFAQDQYKTLDPSARLIDDLLSVAPAAFSGQTHLRTLLGCFLFSDDEVFKRIGVLSGGERNRYALARMLLKPSNLLLLDEPTNHLDLRAKDVLLESLDEFSGTIVFVSHDRYFIDKLATRVFEIENGELCDYAGNYEDYRWQKEHGEPAPEAGAVILGSQGAVADAHSRPDGKQLDPESRPKKLNPILLGQRESRRAALEEDIARCEAAIASCELEAATFRGAAESVRLAKLIGDERARLERLTREWEELLVLLEQDAQPASKP